MGKCGTVLFNRAQSGTKKPMLRWAGQLAIIIAICTTTPAANAQELSIEDMYSERGKARQDYQEYLNEYELSLTARDGAIYRLAGATFDFAESSYKSVDNTVDAIRSSKELMAETRATFQRIEIYLSTIKDPKRAGIVTAIDLAQLGIKYYSFSVKAYEAYSEARGASEHAQTAFTEFYSARMNNDDARGALEGAVESMRRIDKLDRAIFIGEEQRKSAQVTLTTPECDPSSPGEVWELIESSAGTGTLDIASPPLCDVTSSYGILSSIVASELQNFADYGQACYIADESEGTPTSSIVIGCADDPDEYKYIVMQTSRDSFEVAIRDDNANDLVNVYAKPQADHRDIPHLGLIPLGPDGDFGRTCEEKKRDGLLSLETVCLGMIEKP